MCFDSASGQAADGVPGSHDMPGDVDHVTTGSKRGFLLLKRQPMRAQLTAHS